MVRLVVSPFDLSRTLPVGGDLLVPCSSPGPRKTTHANGDYGSWPGWAVSASAPPLTSLHTSSRGGVILQYNLIPTTRSQLRLHELRAQSPTRLPSVQTTAVKFRVPRLPAF